MNIKKMIAIVGVAMLAMIVVSGCASSPPSHESFHNRIDYGTADGTQSTDHSFGTSSDSGGRHTEAVTNSVLTMNPDGTWVRDDSSHDYDGPQRPSFYDIESSRKMEQS